jgi:hypothetical protein
MHTEKFTAQAGIVIGPILFVIALLALLAMVMASGMGDFNTAGVVDRISADVQSQANLIRTKINECNLKYGTNNNYDGYPPSDTTNGTLVSALNCDGDPSGLQNIWTGLRGTSLPPPSAGLDNWYYINTNNTSDGNGLDGTATGGRCIWIQLKSGTASTSALANGLSKAASKFTSNTSNDGVSEVNFDPSKANLRFVMWISTPPAVGEENAKCKPQ